MRQRWMRVRGSWAWVMVLAGMGLTLSGCPKDEYRTVPDVSAQAEAVARAAITAAGLAVGTVTQQCDNAVPAGTVISQNPAGGLRSNRERP